MKILLCVLCVLASVLLCQAKAFAATGFKTGERVSGLNKICYYDVLGSDYSITIGAAQLCPITIDAPNPAPSRTGFDPPATGKQTGFLTGERSSGMNKICYYN